MRKKSLLFFLLVTGLFIQIQLRAQVNLYSFAASSGTYTPITGTQVFGSSFDDDTPVSVPLGFSFSFNNTLYTSCFVAPNGYITFGTTSGNSYAPISAATTYAGAVSPYGRDLQAQPATPTGSVSYTSAGGIFTVQWSEARRYNGATANTERMNMQVQLIQSTGQIKIIYGTWTDAVLSNAFSFGQVGLRGANNADFKSISIASGENWNSPILGSTNAATAFYDVSNTSTKPAQGLTYTFNPPAPCVTPGAPTGLSLSSGFSSVNGSFTAGTPASNSYLVVQTSGTTALNATPVSGTNYTVGATLGNGTVAAIVNSTSFSIPNLDFGSTYTFTVFAFNNLCTGAPFYQTGAGLAGTASTTNSPGFYTWTGATSKDYRVATNWNPNRNSPDPTDILQFSDGLTDSVQNVPTQTVGRIYVVNNTNTVLQSSASATLTFNSDNNPGTPELYVVAGATLKLASNNALGLAFSGNSPIVFISGTLEASTTTGTSNLNTINFTNALATIDVGGVLAAGGTAGNNAVFTSDITSLQFNGTYNHKFTTTGGSAIPTATWNDGSACLISGYTTATSGPNGGASAQNFYDFVYNCPSQTDLSQWSGEFPGTVRDSIKVISTGTGEWQWATTQTFTKTITNYLQTGGTVNVATGATGTKTLTVSGGFRQTGGIFKSTGTNAFTINFKSGGAIQNVNFFDAAPVGPFVYQVSNRINLTGTGALASAFNINTNGGVRISTANATPVNTTLSFAYSGTGSTLTYDTLANLTATAAIFPATNPPTNLTVIVGAGNTLTIPFNRTVPGVTTLTSGDIDLGANTFTVGSSATSTGTLTPNANFFRITTGALSRWFGTSGLPTAVGNTAGNYPIEYNGTTDRSASVYFSTATALSTGGTITIGHVNVTGTTTGLSVNDAGYTIDTRLNTYWSINAGNGLANSGTIGVRVNATNMFSSANINNVRLMKASSVPGVHTPGAGSFPNTQVARIGLTAADLNGNFYVGAAASDINTSIYTAITSGNWTTPSTWDLNNVPPAGALAYINDNITVNVNSNNAIGTLIIRTNANLNMNTGTSLTVGDIVTNNGNINVDGGALTIGPSGGGSRSLTNNDGSSLNITAGTVTINGNLNHTANSTFNQSGGNVIVDGNAGGNPNISVPAGTAIVSFKTGNIAMLGGTFMIVDPHVNSNGTTNTFEYAVTTAAAGNAGPNYTFIFGNGTSTDSSTSTTYGFRLNTWLSSGRFAFSNVIVNGSTGVNRFITHTYATGVSKNLTINANAEWRNTVGLYVGGNLLNNGLMTNSSTLTFSNFAASTSSAASAAQTVTGTGVFRNSTNAVPAANFTAITYFNSFGVTWNIGDFKFSGASNFTAANGSPSKAIIATGKTIEIAGGSTNASATAGWFVGTYQKAATAGGLAHTYPVGSMTAYTPLGISGAAGTVLTGGSIAVGTTSNDHPNIGTSNINPAKSVNRYWTVQAVDGITFTSSAVTVTPNWVAADVDASVVTANLKGGFYNGSWTTPSNNTPTATSIALTGLGLVINGDFQVGEPGGVVPVSLLYFRGEKRNAGNLLSWETLTEQNNNGFELQRSADGRNFSAIAFEKSKAVNGSSNTNLAYSFTDSKTLAGNNYYRLKQVDRDGKASVSNVVLLKGDKVNSLTLSLVYPNPTRDKLNVNIAAPVAKNLTLIISDVNGKIVKQQTVSAIAGDNNFQVDVQMLSNGNYYLKAICTDGCETIITKFTKQ